jgi:Septum formation initiator
VSGCTDVAAQMALTPSPSPEGRGEQDAVRSDSFSPLPPGEGSGVRAARESPHADADTAFRPATAFAFWCCLGVSAALFAAVTLAPKLRSYRELRHEYDAIERKLAVEERQVQHLQQVADALRNDPDFASELARADFGTDDSEERIPVDPRLSLEDASKLDATVANATADASTASHSTALLDTPLLDQLCDSAALRRSLLAAGALLILVGFTLLSGDARAPMDPDLDTRLRNWLTSRYRKPQT